jgi:hypothetical protein
MAADKTKKEVRHNKKVIKKAGKFVKKVAKKKVKAAAKQSRKNINKNAVRTNLFTGKQKPVKSKGTAAKAARKVRGKSVRAYNKNKKDACATTTCGGSISNKRAKR